MRVKIVLWIVVFLGIHTYHCRAADARAAKGPPRVGFVFATGAPGEPSPWFDAFRQGLRDRGYEDGKNILIERRYAEGRLDRMSPFVRELVEQKVDVLMAVNNVTIRAAKEATKTIPIVMISSIDPVAAGYIDSFAHPGGNITGLAWLLRDVSAKRVELIRDMIPKLSTLGALWDADGPGPGVALKEYEAAARAFKLDLRSLPVRGPNPDFASALQTAKTGRLDALIVIANPLMAQHAQDVFKLAAKYRLTSMAEEGRFVHDGGLISYGPSLTDLYRRAADYVVDILKGAKPGDLPVKLPSKFEIFVNLKTAQEIGLTVPQHILVQADKVIK